MVARAGSGLGSKDLSSFTVRDVDHQRNLKGVLSRDPQHDLRELSLSPRSIWVQGVEKPCSQAGNSKEHGAKRKAQRVDR